MRLRTKAPKPFPFSRRERRVPMEVGVQIAGNAALPGVETTFTENVSPRGARVFSSRPWRLNDRLTLTTVTGGFQSIGRVAYCEHVSDAGFAVGVEFVESRGQWVLANASVG